MPDWDEDSPQLRKTLEKILDEIVQEAGHRATPDVDMARNWQAIVMDGLEPDDGNQYYIGRFRVSPFGRNDKGWGRYDRGREG